MKIFNFVSVLVLAVFLGLSIYGNWSLHRMHIQEVYKLEMRQELLKNIALEHTKIIKYLVNELGKFSS